MLRLRQNWAIVYFFMLRSFIFPHLELRRGLLRVFHLKWIITAHIKTITWRLWYSFFGTREQLLLARSIHWVFSVEVTITCPVISIRDLIFVLDDVMWLWLLSIMCQILQLAFAVDVLRVTIYARFLNFRVIEGLILRLWIFAFNTLVVWFIFGDVWDCYWWSGIILRNLFIICIFMLRFW